MGMSVGVGWPRVVGLAAGSLLAAAAAAEPGPGRYAAELCVASAGQPLHCGPLAAEVREARKLTLHHSDIAYELQLHSSQVDVVLRQGPIQLDWFVTNYEWRDGELHFYDAQKRVRYVVRFGNVQR